MLSLALLSVVVAQPGIQQISFGSSSGPYHFGVSTTVSGSNPCPSIVECRPCTSAIGCVWSGTNCYQVVFQVTTCSSPGCATKPSQCPLPSSSGARCNSCIDGGCPSGQSCQGNGNGNSYCDGTCQAISSNCPYGSQFDYSTSKCVVVSCVADNACPPGYTCNTVPCGRAPCPVRCNAPASCNSCSAASMCGPYQICQSVPTPSYSYSQQACVGICVDSAYDPNTQACYSLSSCAECTGATYNSGVSCVWNGVQCYPSSFVCRSRDCVTLPANCPAPCDQPSCESCAAKSGCTWSGYGCITSDIPCTDRSCVTNPSQCMAQTTCSSLQSCTSCLTLNGCLWMGSYCAYSNIPCDGYSGCVTTCDVQQTCSNFQDCYSCVSAANCHWSATTRSCSFSTLACPDSTCASTQAQCTTSQTCYGVTSCLPCSRISGCLWYGNTCYAVPCQGSACAALGYISQCPQPTCDRAILCTECTILDGCMWNGHYCVSTEIGRCDFPGCAVNSAQCPASGCAYGEVYDQSQALCVATTCNAANACPYGYTCNTQSCNSALCPVVCTAPAAQCGVNEQWTSCSSSTCFEATCSDNYATRVCAQDCRSGCQCISGFARGPGNVCVPQASCPSMWG
jgi:hypothetical protein